MTNPSIARILKAKEIVCPSIILGFNYGEGYCTHYVVIDYILKEFKAKSEVVKHYYRFGNSTNLVRGYASKDINIKFGDPLFEVKYIFDVSSHLIDPEKDAPVLTIPSCYKPVEPEEVNNLKLLLDDFTTFLESKERFEEYEPIFKYVEGVFSDKTEVKRLLENCPHLESFNQLITDSEYFDMNLF